MASPGQWQPEEQATKQLVEYLRDALSGHNPAAQKNATIMLGQAKKSPDIPKYLAYIFTNGQLLQSFNLSSDVLSIVRSSAALNLKNIVKDSYKSMDEANRNYVKPAVLACLQDNNNQIRNFAGTVITEIISQGGVLGWPELLPELLALAANERGNTSVPTQEGAMSALAKVCDDHKGQLDKEYQGQRPLEYIIPRLINCTTSPTAKVRGLALASINAFIPQKPKAVISSLDAILERIFQIASDPSDDVRRNVCRSLVLIVDVRPDKIQPHMDGLVEYMTQQQRNPNDSELALEAAEFWLAVSENDKMSSKLGPYLPKIVPVLLESMIYDEEAIMRLEGDADDAEAEDREEDIKPQFATVKSARTVVNGQGNAASNGQSYKKLETEMNDDNDLEDGELEDDEDDEDGEDGAVEESWNLRKCSAAALDLLATTFHDSIFAIALPYLKENLSHRDWPNREAAVLAIGAVAEGCLESVAPNLPELIPYLLSLLDDAEPSVRVITCWALGRYSGWAAQLPDPASKKAYFEPMMEGILKKMLDKNKRVQESAASAFANLEEKAGKELLPYCAPIIQTFTECFEKYKDRNMFILYDCVQTLADQVGAPLRRQDLVDLLMPTMIRRWSKIADQSQEIFPLLECLSYITMALGNAFAPFAVPIFTRCIRIIHQNLEQFLLSVQNPPIEVPNKDFLVTSLDLLSAIIQALDTRQSEELVASSEPGFFELLMVCMEDPNNDVRQSSYALLGDCAVNIFPRLHPSLPAVLPILIRQLDLDNLLEEDIDTGFSVMNNACWSCGEIAIKYKQEMAPFIEDIYRSLITIMSGPEIPTSVSENAVIALGRLGVNCSSILAPHLSEFAKKFLHIIEPVETNDEKCHAFLGFNRCVAENPQAMEQCLMEYFQASSAFKMDRHVTPEQNKMVGDSFQQNLNGYKTMIPNFPAYLGQLPQVDQQTLRSSYGL